MKRVALSPPRLALAVGLAAAGVALALAALGPGAALAPAAAIVAVALAIPFFEWTGVPAALARALPRVVALVVLATALLAWLARSVGTLVLDPSLFPRIAGPVLLAAAIVFSIAPRTFSVGRALAPSIVGLLGVAGLDPSPTGYRGAALPFLKGSEHTAFATAYLALAVVATLALWASTILESGPRWSRRTLATLALSLAAAAGLAAAAVIGLPLLQPHVERAVASAFAEAKTGLSGESTLGEFAELAISRRHVLDLQTSLPEAGAWRLPAEVLTRFDGRRWSNPPLAAGRPPLKPAPVGPRTGPVVEGIGAWFELASAPAEVVELRITQSEVESWPLVVPRGSAAVTADAWLLDVDAHGLVRRPPGDALRLYGALWSGTSPPPAHAPEPREIAEALELPPRVDPRLLDLARKLAASGDAAGRVEATLRHLDSGYRYTLKPGAFRTDDPLAEFLFEKKAGYCEYFASAAVILLRAQGVPARFVKGLSVGRQTDQGGGLHVVRESDAHAWVEAYLPGKGWVEVDPTPPGQLSDARPRPPALSRLAERLRAALSSAWARLERLGPAAFARWLAGRLTAVLEQAVRSPLAWLALAGVVLGRRLLRAIRGFVRRPPPPPRDLADRAVPEDLRALVRDLERRWAGLGIARPPGRGLLEHARRVTGATPPPPPALAAAGPRVVEAYYRARFGGEAPTADERDALRQALQDRASS